MTDWLDIDPPDGWTQTKTLRNMVRFERDEGDDAIIAIRVRGPSGTHNGYSRYYVLRHLSDDGETWDNLAKTDEKATLEARGVEAMQMLRETDSLQG